MREDAVVLMTVVALAVTPAIAGEVEVRLSGIAFEGGPAFELALGGQVIGAGSVDEPTEEGRVFTFGVDDGLLACTGDFTVRLTNDYFAGEGQDRSLSILGGRVGSTVLTPENFAIVTDGAAIARDSSKGALVWSGDEIAVANAPHKGWLGAQAESVTPVSGTDCSASAELKGFAHGSTAIAGLDLQVLAPVIAASQGGACSVTITGYADVSGSELSNRRITAARSAAVLDELIASGAIFPSANIVATDGSEEPDADEAGNRRVTVQLWSPQPQVAAQPQHEAGTPVTALLEEARNASIEHVLVLGWQSWGDLYIRSSNSDAKEVLWLLEQSKARVIAGQPILGPGQ